MKSLSHTYRILRNIPQHPRPASPTGSRVVILTDSPDKERDMPNRAASSTPEDDCSQDELEKDIVFHQEELRKVIERGVTRIAPAEKSIITITSKQPY